MLKIDVYPYEYMNDWEKLNETSIPEKQGFYSHLNMEDITDVDYVHTKWVCKGFEKKFGEYHDFYVQSDILLLADVFENHRNVCLEIYNFDPAKFLSAPEIAWQAALKKAQSKIRSFNWSRYVINGRKRYKRRNMSLYL